MGGMKIDLPFVQAYYDRHGKRRYYFRRKGWPRVTLPGLPGSPEFYAAYARAMAAPARAEPSLKLETGSFKALCYEYEHSTEFRGLAPLTRREMGYVIKALVAEHGDKPVALLERRHVLRWRDKLQEKPGAANKMIRTLKVILTFALERGYRADNPAAKIKMMKIGEWRPWTAEELGSFEARWPIGTLARTGFALALYTGQRRADLARLTWKSIAGGSFRLVQAKTGTALEIPIHPELQVALAAVHPRYEAAILSTSGRPLNIVYFGHLMAGAIEAAGLSSTCVLHGLRKSAAVALIEAGCTPHQAAAITGQRTIRMLEHYAKRHDQAKLARAAMVKWADAK